MALESGPGGLGGRVTALAVNVETYPTHIAGLPVAINICCHVKPSCTLYYRRRFLWIEKIQVPISKEDAKVSEQETMYI